MFSSSVQVKIKKSLVVKKTKILSYGKNGEFHSNNWKIRYYSMFPKKSVKYLTITSISIKWSPTLSHLLNGQQIRLSAFDNRASENDRSTKEIFSFCKVSDVGWKANVETSLNIPVSEMSKGLPFLFNFDLPVENIKSSCEIGILKVSFLLRSSESALPCKIGVVKFSPDLINFPPRRSVSVLNEFESSKDHPAYMTEKADKIVKGYLSGLYTYETMCEKVRLIAHP